MVCSMVWQHIPTGMQDEKRRTLFADGGRGAMADRRDVPHCRCWVRRLLRS